MLYTYSQKLIPSVDSNDFLPPISPWTSLAGIFLVGTVGSAVTLAFWVKYNVTVKAPATVRPIGEIRLVQPKIEGSVKNILVKENQIVKAGEPIAYLDDEQLQIKKSQLQTNLDQGELQLIQLYAQIKSLEVQIIAEKRVIERSIDAAVADLERQQWEYQEKLVKTASELITAEANLQQTMINLEKTKTDLEFAKLDRDRYQQLADVGAISRRDFEQKKLIVEQSKLRLKAEQKAINIAQAKVKTAKVALNPSNAQVAIAQQRIAQEQARGEATIATLMKEKKALIQRQVELQTQLKQYHKELQQVDNQLQSTIIRATSDGIILKLNLRNPGQVIRASEPIAEIVPQDAPLVLKAMIPTSEIQKVAVNQKVQLRVDACAYPDYGTLNGVVSAISPDAIQSQGNNTGTPTSNSAVRYFEATIKPESISFGNHSHICSIQAGMNAKADIISKEETAMQYILRKARLITSL
ncbi:MAG: HlyD family efflux transporter periplasmic adaptor subunit [Nostocaceae cyanobacterium]|nr:HlyD family efflux transporter periplasmic adaptor subunit [Nostocaceae cyanobacterium]